MRQLHYHTTRKLLPVLALCLILPMSIFLLQYAHRAQGASSSTSYPIYNGSLATGWQNWSWSSHVSFANHSPLYLGTTSIAFTPSQIWAGLYLHNDTAVDISPYTNLHFAAQISRSRLTYDVLLFGGTNQALTQVTLANYGGNPVPGKWKVYNIPLADLGATSTHISGVVIQSSSRQRGTLYLSSLGFTGSNSSSTSAPASSADPTATSTTDPTATSDPTATFTTLPPGSALPSDAECAARVSRSSWEPRPDNDTANQTNVYAQGYHLAGSYLAQYGYESRVTGNFTGTTDEIIQWAACKWGFDVDTVRAQAVQESYWHQSQLGDCNVTTQPQTNGCSSVGILQVKAADIPSTHPGTWPYAYESTAFNLDYALAVRRACFEGKETWLGNGYQAGDLWGCIGRWYSGGWHDQGADNYINSVQAIYTNKPWLQFGF